MRNFNKLLIVTAVFFLVSGCKPSDIDVKEGCQILREAGVTKDFHLTADEKKVMTRGHKEVVANLKDWYIEFCP